MRRSSNRQAASIAPVFPAETTASARPSATARQAATSDESGFARTASAGVSPISITPLVSTSSSPPASRPAAPNRIGAIASDAASRAPATISSGPRSAPIASTAMRITGLRRGNAQRLDLAPVVRLAVRADAVRQLRLMADRALVDARRLDPVLRPALVAA